MNECEINYIVRLKCEIERLEADRMKQNLTTAFLTIALDKLEQIEK